MYSLVPLSLSAVTVLTVCVLVTLSWFVQRGSSVALNLSTALGVLSVIVSLIIPAHAAALDQFGSSPLLTILDALQLLGFYAFPIAFVLVRVALRLS